MIRLDSKIPEGHIADKWTNHKFNMKLVNPANKRKFDIIVVGTGLAGASAAASLGALGYNVKAFTYHDSGRRAHSIAAQGGINAAKNFFSTLIDSFKTSANDFIEWGKSIAAGFLDAIKIFDWGSILGSGRQGRSGCPLGKSGCDI